MQRQRGTLVPIGDALSGMGGPVKSLREASPQARRGFTVADQVNQLVAASEADPDLGFMALCSLPRTNPGNRLLYVSINPNENSILTRLSPVPDVRLGYTSTRRLPTSPNSLTYDFSGIIYLAT